MAVRLFPGGFTPLTRHMVEAFSQGKAGFQGNLVGVIKIKAMESLRNTIHSGLRRRWQAFISILQLLLAAAVGLGAWAAAPAAATASALAPFSQSQEAGWPMAGSNPQRTSWTPEEVGGDLKPEWFQHFEAYIPQRVQIVASGGRLFLSTAKGLYALNAINGEELWFYPTRLPLGHSPTVADGVVYVGGFDRQIHAIRAADGTSLWTFEAGAGFQTNPLVVEGKVYAGARDGVFYAVDAASGALEWKFQTGGPILFSAAYAEGILYFASNDNHAYALRASDGTLQWKSEKLPGHGFHSFWPVVAGDYVIFPGSYNYRYIDPFPGPHTELEREGAFPVKEKGDSFQTITQAEGPWANGMDTVDASAAAQYYEKYPHRRTVFVFDRASGAEFTYDSDGDGQAEYAPVLWFGTHSGTRFPPAVGPDGVLYQSAPLYYDRWIPRGRIAGWQPGSPVLAIPPGSATAVDEPVGYAIGGNTVYWQRCCDRMAGAFQILSPGGQAGDLQSWTYFNEGGQTLRRALPELFEKGWDFAYWKHGDSSPPLPYQGRVYLIINNAIVALSPNGREFSGRGVQEGEPTGQKAEDLERADTMPGLNTRLTFGPDEWPLLITQENYYNTDTRPEARARYFSLFEVSIPGQTPSQSETEPGQAGSSLRMSFASGMLEAWSSQRAPGTLFHTSSGAYRLTGAVTALAYPTTNGVRVARPGASIAVTELSEGWLLAWDSSRSHRWMPVLISLENRPSQIAFAESGLELSFAGEAGHLALTPLVGLSDPRSPDAENWERSGLPAPALERVRLLDQLARAFPIDVKEKWEVEGEDALLSVAYSFREFSGAWNTSPLPVAYLPPQLALAAWGESPVEINDQPLSQHLDLDYVTHLGRVAGVAGQSSAIARLPGAAALWRAASPRTQPGWVGGPIQGQLVDQVERMLQAGHLRPAYGITGIWEATSRSRIGDTLVDYWHNPADTTYTLLQALPYLPPDLQRQVRRYLYREFKDYPLYNTAHVGWRDGATRDFFDLPPEVEEAAKELGPQKKAGFNGWRTPPQNFYALWLYAQEFGGAKSLFEKAKEHFDNRPRFTNSTPYALNAYLAGYTGYLRLAELAGEKRPEKIEHQLLDLLVMRAALSKFPTALAETGFEYGGYAWSVRKYSGSGNDLLFEATVAGSLWSQLPLYGFPQNNLYGLGGAGTGGNYAFTLDFVNLTPETAAFLRQYAPAESAQAIESYTQRAPYWFVGKAAEAGGEGVFQPLYERAAIFQAMAWINHEPHSQLVEYLDVPATPIGDLFYIQNLVAILQAQEEK